MCPLTALLLAVLLGVLVLLTFRGLLLLLLPRRLIPALPPHTEDMVLHFGSGKQHPRIAIFMWYDDGARAFGDINFEINRAYCEKHGYALIRSSKVRTCKGPLWERVPLLLAYLEAPYEHLVWVDADAFCRIDRPLDALIREHSASDLILSADYPAEFAVRFEEHMWRTPDCSEADARLANINSGVLVVRRTAFTQMLLEHWLHDEKFAQVSDQAGLRMLYIQNWQGLRKRAVVLPYGMIQSFDPSSPSEAPIMHLAGSPLDERVRVSSEYYHRLRR